MGYEERLQGMLQVFLKMRCPQWHTAGQLPQASDKHKSQEPAQGFPPERTRDTSGKRADAEQEIPQGLIKLICRATSPKAAAAFPAGAFWSFLKPTTSIPGWTALCSRQGCPRWPQRKPERAAGTCWNTGDKWTLLVDRARGQAGICIIPPASAHECCGSFVHFDPTGIPQSLTQPSVSYSPFIRDYITRKLNSNTENDLNRSLNVARYTNLLKV